MDRVFALPIARHVATIANGASVSSSVPCSRLRPVAIIMPAAWDAAVLTAQTSSDGGVTWSDVFTRFSEWTCDQAAANRRLLLDPIEVITWELFRLRSGTSAAAVNQTALRSLTILLAP